MTRDEEEMKEYGRFELVLLAAQRGREIAGGSPPTLERHGDKNAVLALREIHDRTVSVPALYEALIHGFQESILGDELEEDTIGDQFVELMVEEKPFASEEELAMSGFSLEDEDDLMEDEDDLMEDEDLLAEEIAED